MTAETLSPNVSFSNPARAHHQLSTVSEENKVSEHYEVEK